MEVQEGIDGVVFLTTDDKGELPEIGLELDMEDVVFLEMYLHKVIMNHMKEHGEKE